MQRGFPARIATHNPSSVLVGSCSLWTGVSHYNIRVKNEIAGFDQTDMCAAHEVNGPRLAHAIFATDKVLALHC